MLSQIFGGGEHSIALKPLPDGVDAVGPTGAITVMPPAVAARERVAAARGERPKPMEPGKWTLKVKMSHPSTSFEHSINPATHS